MRNRLHALCPYFAMFPEDFVAKHVEAYTRKNDYVFDPFCGRGTTVLQSLLMDRNAAGTDINPVAYCVSNAKARIPAKTAILARIDSLERSLSKSDKRRLLRARDSLPLFFRWAYRPDTLLSVLHLRHALRWRENDVDRFIAALVLGALHGETERSSSYLSNQMPRTISTKPAYSIRYWRDHHLRPPRRDVFELLRKKALYRLSTEVPARIGAVSLGDAREAGEMFPWLEGRVKAVITSPPYLDATRYEEDQWLRLWFLGYESKPTYAALSRDDRHTAHDNYWDFLAEAWEGIVPLVGRGAILVCRLAAKGLSRRELAENLHETISLSFPRAYMISSPKLSKIRRRQTGTFQPGARGFFLRNRLCL